MPSLSLDMSIIVIIRTLPVKLKAGHRVIRHAQTKKYTNTLS